jgi:dipeptidyl aminopeptidase/acylaminoacyl peptidase
MSAPSQSPDGEWVAFTEYRRQGGVIYVIPAGGGEPRRVTSGSDVVSPPAWSPDGRALAFIATDAEGGGKVRTVSFEGGREHAYEKTDASVSTFSGGDLVWAPGERILYRSSGFTNYYYLDPSSEAEEPLVASDSVGHLTAARYSPTADRVAVQWNRGTPTEEGPRSDAGLWAVSLRDASQSLLMRRAGPPIGWSADGGAVYAIEWDSGDVVRVPLTGGEPAVVTTLPFESGASCTATERDGRVTLLCTVSEYAFDAWMIENFDPDIR